MAVQLDSIFYVEDTTEFLLYYYYQYNFFLRFFNLFYTPWNCLSTQISLIVHCSTIITWLLFSIIFIVEKLLLVQFFYQIQSYSPKHIQRNLAVDQNFSLNHLWHYQHYLYYLRSEPLNNIINKIAKKLSEDTMKSLKKHFCISFYSEWFLHFRNLNSCGIIPVN